MTTESSCIAVPCPSCGRTPTPPQWYGNVSNVTSVLKYHAALTSYEYPVLAAVWDNEDDAIYDEEVKDD